MISKIRSFSARHGMFGRGMKIVVGVSGGADSVGLLQVLRQIAPEYDLRLHVVHLNHMLRPEAADDAAFVRQLAHRFGLPVTIGCARVDTIARRLRTGIEEAGRLARYRLLEQVADRIGAQRIAVGHHAGDQVETVLLNLMRGAGPGGLAGIPPRRGRVVRPLLCASKEEIAAYCQGAGLEWRTDASNLSPEFLRNRIRHRLLPLLRKEFNPRFDQAVLRLAEIVGEEDRWFRRHAKVLLSQLLAPGTGKCSRQSGQMTAPGVPGVRPPSGSVRLTLSAFVCLPLALRRRLLLVAVRRAGGSLRHLGYQNVANCLDFLSRGAPGGTVQLPGGVRVSKNSTCFTVAAVSDVRGKRPEQRSEARGRNRGQRQEVRGRKKLGTDVPLPVPGKALLPGLGLVIRARVVDITPGGTRHEAGQLWDAGDGSRVCFDYDQLEAPLAVRTRRAGDRLRPFGMQGAKKLKKLLGELRVSASDRDRVALVVSGGEIIWVAGYRRSQAAPVTEQTRRMLILEAGRL
ncbi:MAG: tRNA lysidine(34) synthetase TilS [Thermacetogeniaceae bacterium]